MSGKWRQDKIGRRTLPLPHYEDNSDPANGEKVPRCRACGLPNPKDLVGTWGGLHVRFPLCQACVFRENPPDPLDGTQAA